MSISAKIGWVVFILDMVLLFVCALVICAIVLLAKDGSKAQAILNKMKLNILATRRKLITLIFDCLANALFILALVVLCLHQSPISIIAFILATMYACAGAVLFLLIFKIIKFIDDNDNQPKLEDKKVEVVKEDKKEIAQANNDEDTVPNEIKEITIEDVESKQRAQEALSLKESFVLAKATESSNGFTKKYVADYLRRKANIEICERENLTQTGLPLADTHYVIGKNKKKCFAYVYETEGSLIFLAMMDKEYADKLKEKHPRINLSLFPKQKNSWYSLIIDDSYTKEEFEKIIDEVIDKVLES